MDIISLCWISPCHFLNRNHGLFFQIMLHWKQETSGDKSVSLFIIHPYHSYTYHFCRHSWIDTWDCYLVSDKCVYWGNIYFGFFFSKTDHLNAPIARKFFATELLWTCRFFWKWQSQMKMDIPPRQRNFVTSWEITQHQFIRRHVFILNTNILSYNRIVVTNFHMFVLPLL